MERCLFLSIFSSKDQGVLGSRVPPVHISRGTGPLVLLENDSLSSRRMASFSKVATLFARLMRKYSMWSPRSFPNACAQSCAEIISRDCVRWEYNQSSVACVNVILLGIQAPK
jgi:hypothetical protein